MSIEQTRAKVIANVWQAIAQSSTDLSFLSQEDQEKFVRKLADNLLVTVDQLLDEAQPAPPPETASHSRTLYTVSLDTREFLCGVHLVVDICDTTNVSDVVQFDVCTQLEHSIPSLRCQFIIVLTNFDCQKRDTDDYSDIRENRYCLPEFDLFHLRSEMLGHSGLSLADVSNAA